MNVTEHDVNVSFLLDELNDSLAKAVLPVTAFIGFESLFGLVGNILILFVYGKRYEQSNFRLFVLFMAMIDLTSCLTTLPGEMFSQTNWYKYKYSWICKIKSFLNVMTVWASASILVILGFDRYRKICRPLLWQIQPRLAKRACCISIVLSTIAASPALLLWGKQTYTYEYFGIHLNVSICEKSDKYADGIYPKLFIFSVYVLPLVFMACFLCSLNVMTAKTLFRRKLLFYASKKTSESCKSFSNSSLYTLSGELDLKSANDMYVVNRRETSDISLCSTLPDSDDDKKTSDKNDGNKTNFSSTASVKFALDNNTANVEGVKRTSGLLGPPVRGVTKSDSLCPGPTSPASGVSGNRKGFERMRQKTIIMLVLFTVFVITMALYVSMTFVVAGQEGVLKQMPNSEKVAFFFFWRLYFINTNINPVLYGLMDARFRAGLLSFIKSRKYIAK